MSADMEKRNIKQQSTDTSQCNNNWKIKKMAEILQEWIHYTQPCTTSRLCLPKDEGPLYEWSKKYEVAIEYLKETAGIEPCTCRWCEPNSSSMYK